MKLKADHALAPPSLPGPRRPQLETGRQDRGGADQLRALRLRARPPVPCAAARRGARKLVCARSLDSGGDNASLLCAEGFKQRNKITIFAF